MSNPYDGPPQGNPFAAVALITGLLALVGSGCCCVPIVNYIAILMFPLTALLMITAIVTGFLGIQRAKQNGEGMPLAVVGLVAGGVGALLIALQMALGGLAMVFAVLAEMM